MVGGARVCEQYAMRSVCVVYRPSGPPRKCSLLEVYAIEPIGGHCAGRSDYDVESYVIRGLHVCVVRGRGR